MDGAIKKSIDNYTFSANNNEPLVIGRAGLNWDATHFWKGFCGGIRISKSAVDVSVIPISPFPTN